MARMIDNKIIQTNKADFESTRQEINNDEDLFIVELDGAEVHSWEDYILNIQRSFDFPSSCVDNIDRYLDWIRDLDWLNKEGYVLIINNASRFLEGEDQLREAILSDFNEYILPFWQEEVESCVVGGKAKSFMVYLVE